MSLGITASVGAAASDWQPANGPLFTRWAKDVKPESVHKEYPRPQMVRKAWQNLNGLWDLAIQPRKEAGPSQYGKKILVPFPIESALSGVMERVGEDKRAWYRRTFTVPGKWSKQRLLLHFGAVDWETVVWINGKEVGTHTGGYDPFTFDITDALKADGEQEIVVAVWDPTDGGPQPIGKQTNQPRGILYTPVTGIWQTVWLEPVPTSSIEGLKILPEVDKGSVRITVAGKGGVKIEALDGGKVVAESKGICSKSISLPIPNAKLWSPDRPFLYGLKVTLLNSRGRKVDEVDSYFGMRKVSLGKDKNGITRIMLNNKPVFQAGPLDQGFWPDGIYTAPTDKALRYDIEVTKQLGFNMARKHVKVEPARWYYWCDKLGLLVWQDMVSGGAAGNPQNFEKELRAMIAANYNSPSIVMWVVFNEGWGQHDTKRYVKLVEGLDRSRIVNNASGWTDEDCGDVEDWHVYPGPGSPTPTARRAAVLGEFGGLGLPIDGHMWQAKDNWGYRSYADRTKLTEAIVDLYAATHLLIGSPGLSACVYTQTTDVEIEANGLLTYDRAMIKGNAKKIREAVMKLYTAPPTIESVIPTSEKRGLKWRYTTEKPGENWFESKFDDSSWSTGVGGFGKEGTPGGVVRTPWTTSDIWIRREFTVPAQKKWNRPLLSIHHDEDAEVYLDGKLIGKFASHATGYALVPFPKDMLALLKPGKHTIAVHCHQTHGGQYIDVGIVDVAEAKR